ncbi:MAG: hypothetical protein JTT13_06695 [Candidatus Brockarchaeota archaeon]|nr:hypothetical protein [Candidatus Brockarchaeota archaeon]
MMKRVTGILLILILLAAENPVILVNLGGAGEQPASVELDTLIREIELGIPPEGPLSDREFIMPEGVSMDDVKNLWRYAASFVSHGADDNDIRTAFSSLMESVRLPDAARVGNESFQIRYDKAYVKRNGFGAVLIHIPIDVPLFRTLPACFHVYSRAIGGKQHLVYNVTETRWYKIRRRIEGLYNITYMDLETGEAHSVLSSLSLGVYPEFGIAGGSAQPSFPSFLLKYFPEYANLTTIPPGTMIDFSRSTPSFLVAVPGHYEDIDVLIPEHEENFRVLFPAYDPVWLSGWLVEASLSSSSVETGDILEVSYVATPLYIDPEEQPLNATLTLHYPDGFEPLDDARRVLNNTQTQGCFKLKAIAPGTYILTLKLDGNAFFPGWPPPDEVTYTVNVVGPESPRVEVSLEGGEPFFKHVNITVRLENKGAGEALNTVLEFTGDVEPLSLSVGSIPACETWIRMVTLKLRSEVASIRARAIFFDSSGNKYVSEGFTTVVSPAYVVPEHFEEYTLRVPEHFEKRRVFVPGYEGYTHVKIYHPYSAFEIPGSFTISFQGLILEAEGVKVYTSFLPIADEGFELRVIPKEVTLNIYGDVLVGPLIPVQGLQTTVPVKYVVKSVMPAFEEKLVRENEAKSILNVTGCGEIVAPEGYKVTLASKRVVRKPLWVDTSAYRRLQQEDFGRIREGCYWYEDGNKEEWPSSDAILELTPLERELYANRIILLYHPLQETPLESSLIRGIWLRNYATQDIDYTFTVEPVTLPPGKSESTILKAEKACCKELSILLFSNTTFWIRLRKGDRLVAELFLPRVLSPPFPLSLQWWRGFILGLINRSDRIMVNMMMLGTVAMVPRELMPVIAVALTFLKAYQVYNQRGEIFNATTALRNLTAMGLIYSGMATGYRLQGKHGFAAICDNLSQTFLSKAGEVASDLGLRLVMDVKLEEVKTALGWKNAGEYEQGYATGKIVGAMIEAVTYAATFATIYHEFSTARDMLTMAGQSGRISASSVLKRFAQGLYAWVTPAIWDLAETGMKFGAWLKGKLTLPDVLRLIFAGQVSKDFGENVEKALKTLPDGGEPEEIAKRASNIVDRVTSDKGVPESIATRILSILGRMGEEYVGREDTAKTIVEAWKRVSKLEAWKKGGEPGKLLMDWLGSLEKKGLGEALYALQKSMGLGDEELNSIGKALTKVGGGFENGLKLFDAYFSAGDHYGKRVAKVFLENVVKHPERLDTWLNVFTRRLKTVFLEPDSRDSLIIEEKGVEPGVYRVTVIDPETGEDAAEGVRGTVEENERGVIEEKRTLRFREAEFDTNRDYLAVFTPYGVKDFLQDVEAPPKFVRLGGGDRMLLVTSSGEPVAELDANVKAASGSVYLEFKYDDVDRDTQQFRLSISGELYLGQAAKGETVFKQRVVGIGFKVFDDGAGKVLAKLLEITYGEKASPMHLVMERSIPDTGTFFLRDRDRLRGVAAGQTKITLGEDFEKVLGRNGLENLRNMLRSKKAALALVYVGEDNTIHSVWSQELEFSFKHHPVKEDGIIGLYVVRIDGIDGVDLVGKTVRLTSTTGDGYELAAKVGYEEVRIPVEEPYVDTMGPRKYLKMTLPDDHVLGLRLNIGEDGKLHAELAIYRDKEDTFRDLKLLKLVHELENYYGRSDKPDTLKNLLVGEYVEDEKTKPVFISMDGSIKRGILDQLNKNPEHTLLEINAITLFKSIGESIVAIEKKLELSETRYRIIDITTEGRDGTITLVECKHGYETETDPGQITDYFTYAKMQILGDKKITIRLFIGNDITGEGAKYYVKHAIGLHEQLYVPLEIYIKGELKSLDEVKGMVGG